MENLSMLSKIVLDRLQARLQAERLPLSIRLWDSQTLVGTLPASVTLALNTPRAVSLFIRPSLSRLAEAYVQQLSLIHISEPTRRTPTSYAVFCLKKKQ